MAADTRSLAFRYRSPEHWLEVFRTWYGPVLKALASLPEDRTAALEHDLLSLVDRLDVASDGIMVVSSEHLEVVLTKR